MINYRKIIKSRTLRMKILSLLEWVPDSIMIRLQYWIQTGRRLNLRNPKRYTEKLQLYKMRYRNPDMLRCTDKYEVRGYVEQKGYADCLVPLLGVYDDVEMINFADLPDKFVAKSTDGGGGNQVFVCRDKSCITESDFKQLLGGWLSSVKAKKHIGREWAYDNNYPRRIIIEQLIGEDDDKDLYDYKFFCFNGRVSYIYGISDRHVGQSAQFGIYDRAFNKLDVSRTDERPQDVPLQSPPNFEQMMTIAESLAKDFPHVRVDMYNVKGKIYFGELTFYDGSGYMTFNPDSFDEQLGSCFDISSFI